MGERTIPVLCPWCEAGDTPILCRICEGSKVIRATLAPSSLAALQIALAEAVDREAEAESKLSNEFCFDEAEQVALRRKERKAALAAVRAHPMYRRPE